MYFPSTIIFLVLVATSEACSGLYARDVVPEWGYNPDDGAMMWYNMDPVKNKLVCSTETFKYPNVDFSVVWQRHPSVAHQSQ
jgi:hypothetical protein